MLLALSCGECLRADHATMSDWDPRANEIFLAAVELANVEKRRALLDEQCGSDTGLRAQVESLLAASKDAGDFLEQPVVEPAATIVNDEIDLDFLARSESPDSLGRLGEYEISGVIGRGGMGIVLEGQDAQLNRVVAIKVLTPEMSGNTTARRRFLREAQAAAAVTHQQVVTIHAVNNDKVPYLVMERISGQSLQEKIEAEGTLSLKEVLRIGMQIASGLAAAHAQGLIHRDIKPSNILLENGVERVRITDFGLARAVDDVSITGTGQVAGSPQYMSPEQAQGHTVDGRSDLFSLGCVLYAMCTGRSPFRAETTVAALRRVCEENPRSIRDVNPEVPDWLVEIIDRLLEKTPDARIQTAREVADLLGGHLAHVQDPDSTPPPVSVARPPHRANGRSAHVLLGVVSLLLAFGGLYLAESTGVTNFIDWDGTSTDDALLTDVPHVAGPGGEVDLLRTVDLNSSPMVGRWRIEDDVLVSPGTGRWDRLDLLYSPPEQYDLEVTAERSSGNDMLSITLLSGQRQFFVGLDMFEGRLCGLGLIDGKDAFTNETTTERAVFDDRLPHKIVCRVRRSGVSLSVDGETVVDWRGSLDRLSIPESGRTGHFGLMAMRSEYRFYDVILKPVRNSSVSPPVITEVRRFEGHTGSVKQVAVSRNGMLAVSCSGVQGDRSVRFWDIATGREIRSFDTSGRQIMAVRFLPDEQQVVGAGFGGVIHFWNVATGELIRSFETGTEIVDDLAISPDGRQLLCVTHKRAYPTAKPVPDLTAAQLWDLDTEELIWQFDGPGWLQTGAFLLDGGRVVVAGRQTGNAAHLLDRETGTELAQFEFGDGDDLQVEDLAISHDGRLIAMASELGYVCLWDVNDRSAPIKYRPNMGNLRSVAFSPDDRRLLCGGGEGIGGSIQLLSVSGLDWISSVEHPGGLAWDVAWMPDGSSALSAGGWTEEGPGDYDLKLWRLPEVRDVPERPTTAATLSEFRRYPTDHTGPVLCIAVSPDGHVIATGSSDKQVRLFDRVTGRVIRELNGGTAFDLQFTADGGHLLAAGDDGTVRLWDVEAGEQIREFEGHRDWVSSVDLSQDGRIVLTGGVDGTIRFWDFDSGNQLHEISADFAGEYKFAFSVSYDANSERFVSAHHDGTVTIWNALTREQIATIPAHEGYVYVARFSPDGRTLLTAGSDNVAHLWNIDGRRRRHTFSHGEEVTEGEFLLDGRFVVTSSRDKTVELWDVITGRSVATATGPTHFNSSFALLPDGRHLVSAGGLLKARSENGRMVWIGDGDYDVREWRLPDIAGVRKLPSSMPEVTRYRTTHTEPVFSIAVSPEERVIATGSSDESIHLYDRSTGTTLKTLEGHFALGLRFTSDGRRLLSAGDDGTLRLWSVETGDEIRRFEGHVGWVLSVDLSPDGRTVLSGGEDGTIRLWDFDSSQQQDRVDVGVEVESRAVFCARYADDGTRIVSSHHDGTVSLWDSSTLTEITTIPAHSGKAYTARLSRTGRVLVTSGNDDVGRLWDVEAGRRLHTFPHAENVTIAELIANDRYVVTGSGDKTVRIWNLQTGQEVAHARASTHCTTAVAVLADGHLVSAGGLLSARTEGGAPVWEGDGDYDLHVWRLPESVRVAREQTPSSDRRIAELTQQIAESPDDGRALITRAYLYVRQSRWQEAADDLQAAGNVLYDEPANAFLYAVLLVHLEEFDVHQQHCTEMLLRFADTNDVWTANCLVKSCLLRPGSVDLGNLPTHLLSNDYELITDEPAWVLREARALHAYRNGEFAEARRLVRETMALADYRDDPLYAPRALSILAMSAHQSGETKLGRKLYEQAAQRLDQIVLTPDDIRATGWVYAEILRREAARVLEDTTSPEDTSE